MVKKLKIKNMKQILLVTALAGTMLIGGCASQTTTSTSDTSTQTTSTETATEEATEESTTEREVPDAPPDSEGGFDESSGSSVETTGVLTIDGTTETLDGEDLTSTISN